MYLKCLIIYFNIFCLVVHSPRDCNGWLRTDTKPGARSFFQISHMGTGSQDMGQSLANFPGNEEGVGWEVGLPGLVFVHMGFQVFNVRTLASRPACRALIVAFQKELIHFITHSSKDKHSNIPIPQKLWT